MVYDDLHTDDTGIEVGLIVGAALGLTLAAPRVAALVALGVGLPLAVYSLAHAGAPGLFALALSGLGAAIGYGLRRVASAPSA